MKSFLFICLFIIASISISLPGIMNGSRKVLIYDNSGYHLYLPAIFIYHDLGKLSFYPDIDTKYSPTGDIKWYSIYEQPTGRKLNKYAIGSSLLEAPFFLLAHVYTAITQKHVADGYSLPYQLALAFSYIFWGVCGLFLLRKVLNYYYTDKVVLFTLVCITLGTNLFYQAALGGGSHPYAFFLVAATLYLTQQWHLSFRKRHLYLSGITLGLLFIVRPVDVLVAIIPLLWGVYNATTLKNKLLLLQKHTGNIIVACILFFCIAMLQMAYWKYTTGHWLYFSYQGERFNFTHPHIINGLFSYRKGWFIYTPIAFISLAGFYFLMKTNRKIVLPLLLSLAIAIYIIFSWENWWYGGGFSSRPMVDFLPILSIPLAALLHYIMSLRSTSLKTGVAVVFTFFIMLNLFQTWQYTHGILHHDRMTRAYYWRIFGKTYATTEDREYLMNDKEYWDAMRAAYD